MKVKSRNVLRKTDQKDLVNDIIEAFGDASAFENRSLNMSRVMDRISFSWMENLFYLR